MEIIKLKMLLVKYENQLKRGNTEHLKDYIGARVVLALSLPSIIISSNEINNTTLNGLICQYAGLGAKIIDYKVPSLQLLHKIQNDYSLYIKNKFGIPIDMIQSNGAATWLGLMIETGMISAGDTIDLTQYRLIDFIKDGKLKKILGVSETVNYDLVGNNRIVYEPKKRKKL